MANFHVYSKHVNRKLAKMNNALFLIAVEDVFPGDDHTINLYHKYFPGAEDGSSVEEDEDEEGKEGEEWPPLEED